MKQQIGCLLLAAVWASAQSGGSGSSQAAAGWQPSWKQKVQESGALAERGQLSEAEVVLRDIQRRMEDGRVRGEPLACVLAYLGGVYRMQGRYPEAEEALQRALKESTIALEASGGEDYGRVWVLLTLAQLRTQLGRMGEAERLLLEVVDLHARFHQRESRLLVLAMSHLGEVYRRQSKYAEAEAALKKAISNADGTGSAAALALNHLALVLDATRRTPEAVLSAERAIAILEQLGLTRHPDFAALLANLAVFYTKCGRFGEAEPLFVRALAIQREMSRGEHLTSGYMLRDYAVLLKRTGRGKQSREFAKRSRAILDRAAMESRRSLSIDVHALRRP